MSVATWPVSGRGGNRTNLAYPSSKFPAPTGTKWIEDLESTNLEQLKMQLNIMHLQQ